MKGFMCWLKEGAWVLGLLIIYGVIIFGVVGGLEMAFNGEVALGLSMVIVSIVSILGCCFLFYSNEPRGT